MMLSSVASAFDRNPRRRQELRGRPIANHIYKDVLGVTGVYRFDGNALDTEFAVDVRLTLPSGLVLCGQEKFLSAEYAKYHSITVEFEQNQHTHEPGDWFKEACQFYFVGYETLDKQQFSPWIIVNWTSVVLATEAELIKWNTRHNADGKARASFRWCDMHSIPEQCIIAKSW